MQLAGLIEPREGRSLGKKIRQIFRAIQIERRLSKEEILERYLTLAPYGGNLEGLRAASLAYFGKEPRRLTRLGSSPAGRAAATAREAPARSPCGECAGGPRPRARAHGERRRAWRARGRAGSARRRLRPAPCPARARRPCLGHGVAQPPAEPRHALTISRSAQEGLEAVRASAAKKLGPRVSVAMVLADAMTGEILARSDRPISSIRAAPAGST